MRNNLVCFVWGASGNHGTRGDYVLLSHGFVARTRRYFRQIMYVSNMCVLDA